MTLTHFRDEVQGSIPAEQLEKIAQRLMGSDRSRNSQEFGMALQTDLGWNDFIDDHELELSGGNLTYKQRVEFEDIRNVLMGTGVRRYDRFTRGLTTGQSQAQQQGITIREFFQRGRITRRFVKDNKFISAANVGRMIRGSLIR